MRDVPGGTAMKLPRRQFLHLVVGAAALPAVSRIAWAEAYPTRPVRLIFGFTAGSGGDVISRIFSQWLSERFGQSFIVENRLGAGSNIAAEAVVNAPADGHTLLVVTSANTINATTYENLNFNFVRDIAPVSGMISAPLVMLVSPSRSEERRVGKVTGVQTSALPISFIVENRLGAGSNIAAEAVVNAPADGHTLLVVTSANTINATTYENLNFNIVRDIAPVSGMISAPLVMLVSPS